MAKSDVDSMIDIPSEQTKGYGHDLLLHAKELASKNNVSLSDALKALQIGCEMQKLDTSAKIARSYHHDMQDLNESLDRLINTLNK
ncbi:hypothetical protein [Limosilactobacillus reuteri]|uniref:Uncharacterized protein n=1 Tax=Limosilactobacillus reuteri TaxID=1598 RepID=A0AAW9ZLW1_LIMRT|nr:hypothetical protein [Limosilactobacillus reuteri]MCC4358012.1 hypothetical protein [Limosilactobacillus reuteri]MCC4362846.1 hypothetical protein [Limosilactobacillus reuteri]MCC4363952.1 hypothetical protein [Limosilactobacillus reuteri]NME22970.1 hypothetical protein [Limosilactobacillus reuteri]QWS05368.1 hypothetical protein I6U32_11945 [Limosilactobacillus reuteri]